MSQSLSINAIRIDGGTQPRAVISTTTVAEYAEAIRAGKVFPPIDVFFDGVDHWLADGFHRYHATKRLEQLFITAMVHTGTRREAVLFAVGANHGHGLQRTQADKRKAVLTLLDDAEWGTWSNVQIGKLCGVDEATVRRHRGDGVITSASPKLDAPVSDRTYIDKHGTEATMHVEKIGKRKRDVLMPDRSPKAVKERRDQIRTMAGEGYRLSQIAAKLELSEEGCRSIIRAEGIVLPADRIGKSKRLDANRIVDHIVMDADNLTADTVALIDYDQLDRAKLTPWITTLTTATLALAAFLRRLKKEQQKHEAA